MSTWMMVRGELTFGTGCRSATRPASAGPEAGSHGGQRLDHKSDVLVEVDVQFDGAAVDVISVDRSSEGLVLELFLDRSHLEARDGPARSDEGARRHEA